MVKRENGNTFKLGQEVCGRRLTGSDLSPHWLNMVEDGCWYGEGRLIIKKVHKIAYPPVVEKVSKRVEMLFLYLTYQVVGGA